MSIYSDTSAFVFFCKAGSVNFMFGLVGKYLGKFGKTHGKESLQYFYSDINTFLKQKVNLEIPFYEILSTYLLIYTLSVQ